jgi:hypothetical protein
MSTFLTAIQLVNTVVLQIAAVLNGKLVLQPVKLPEVTGMVPYNKQ